jgi:2-keto-3-deoxy-L-rhamnonate aldolase RhmA
MVGGASLLRAELMARVGVDYVCVDVQHGILGYDAMVPMFQAISAAGVAPITRVVHNDPGEIGKALDAGAWGVIVPLVNDAEEAARAVARPKPGALRHSWKTRGSHRRSALGSERGGRSRLRYPHCGYGTPQAHSL